MIRLKQAHKGERALVIFGGPSLIVHGFDFSRVRDLGFVTFLDTKALTPQLVQSGFRPDYYLMLFPEKTKDNSLQHFVFRSFLASYRIDRLLTPEHRETAVEMRQHFDEYFEPWRPHKGTHKRYRWRPDVYLRHSPYDLLSQIPEARIIVNRRLLGHYFPAFPYGDRTHSYLYTDEEKTFDIDKYFNPLERDGTVYLRCADTFFNSAAIALYPILNYLGFREVYYIGMDMSLLGSMEYSAPFTFRSMMHFGWFMWRNGYVFSSNYKRNGWMFKRPQSEFDNLRMLWTESPMTFTRVYDPWRYANSVDGIRTTSTEQFFRN